MYNENTLIKNRLQFPSWRRFLPFMLLAAWISACAPAQQAQPAADLVVVAPQGVIAQAARGAAAQYQAERGVTVRVEGLSGDAYMDRVSAVLLSGGQSYDLVYLPAASLARWGGYHALRPLQPLTDPAVQPWLPGVTVGGDLLGLPTQPELIVLWYRADLFSSAGLSPPRTWAAFRSAALALNAPPERYGLALSGSGLDSGLEFSAVLAGFGLQAVDSQYQVVIDTPEGRAALKFYADLATVDHVAVPPAWERSWGDNQRALAAGQAAMALAPLGAAATLQDCSASPKACQNGKPLLAWSVLPGLPARTGFGSLSAWAVPLRAADAGAGEDFARWLCSAAGAQAWAKNGGIPARSEQIAETGVVGPGLGDLDHFEIAFPPFGNIDSLWAAYHRAVHAAVSGAQPPEQALRQAANEIKQALRQAGY